VSFQSTPAKINESKRTAFFKFKAKGTKSFTCELTPVNPRRAAWAAGGQSDVRGLGLVAERDDVLG
jgi:hypothetical protein